MAKFCGNCGSPLKDIAIFCGVCGAKVPAGRAAEAPAPAPTIDTAPVSPVQDPAPWTPAPTTDSTAAQTTSEPAAWAPVAGTYAPPPAASVPAPAAYTPGNAYPVPAQKKSNTLLKVVVVLVVFLFVGGALALAGLWYAAQKINAKAHAAAAHVLGGSPAGGALGSLLSSAAANDSNNPSGFTGDPCRFLSKAEVSQAVGVQIIRTDGTDNGCSYIAKGDPADATSKHMASMIGGMGVDANTQKTIQKIAGGFFAQQQASDKDLAAQAAKGEITVLGVLFTSGNAQLEMKMNRGAFQHISGGAGTAANSGTGDLDGIGDEAYLAGGGMLMFRKGNTMARFTYIGCPCNTDNIKPLAKLVASRL